MAIRVYKPTTNARRNMSVNLHEEVTRTKPEKSLLAPKKRTGGRNNQGKVTVRGRGGGHKRRYRRIDFKRTKDGMPATVLGIEYDPNRTCHIALVQYEDGTKRYILAPRGIKDGDVIESSGRPHRAEGRQLHAAQEHPDRSHRPQRGVRAGQGWKDLSLRGGRALA